MALVVVALAAVAGAAAVAAGKSIIFGGGCFWCSEATFLMVRGVLSVTSGYAGGTTPNPDYQSVCSGATGHAEVVKVDFDPNKIKLKELLTIFWTLHDPTTLDRQGADIGTQYRSIVFYESNATKAEIESVRNEMQMYWQDPIVTQISPLDTFWPAEEYHQNYFAKNPSNAYCQVTINPKIAKLRTQFNDLIQPGL